MGGYVFQERGGEALGKRILAIETSCDETAAAIVEDGRTVISQVVLSSMDIFKEYGGVVPEIASRKHVEYIIPCLIEAMKSAKLSFDDLDAVGVTYGPGLVGALLTGVSCAKAISLAKDLPLVPVNHIEGHICANYLTHPELKPPFVCLIISGGHSHLVRVDSYSDYTLIGKTRDDAVGEVFDKVARFLGLEYPGGPNVEKLAASGQAIYEFPRALKGQKDYDFSFSGLKTAVINKLHNMDQTGEAYNPCDVAASFQENVASVLAHNAMRATSDYNLPILAVAGGVSCNQAIRVKLEKECRKSDVKLYLPDKKWCTDNAAMIGSAAFYNFEAGKLADLTLNAHPSLKLC